MSTPALPLVVTTADGDVLDYLVWRHYGRQDDRLVEAVLAANHGLCERGAVLGAGLEILLPPSPPRRRKVRTIRRFWGKEI